MTTPPWTKYCVSEPAAKGNYPRSSCDPFTNISHVTHVDNAIAIIQKNRINPQLIYDESILNTDRILVNWLSPNYWSPGYRYGNVMFTYDFPSLIAGKKYYWVEAITQYNTPALRLLVTDQDRGADPRLIPYDPTIRHGPWWHDVDTDVHFRNGDFTLEFMLEDGLTPAAARAIHFVKHNPNHCCIDRETCRDLGLSAELAAYYFAMGISSHDIYCHDLPFSNEAFGLMRNLIPFQYHHSKDQIFKGSEIDGETASALATSWFFTGYRRNFQKQQSLSPLFNNPDQFWNTICDGIDRSFPRNKMQLR